MHGLPHRATARSAGAAAAPHFAARLTAKDFLAIAALVRQHAGLHLPEHKIDMVERRVQKRLLTLGCASFAAYCSRLREPENAKEIEHLVNSLTTNKTEFFRERHHFAHLGKVLLPSLRRSAEPRLRFWSAGCSTGQEAYSIAMTLLGAVADLATLDARILGTDVDTAVLATARRGVYADHELAALTPASRGACFAPEPAVPGRSRVALNLQQLVSFRHHNLHGDWPMKGPFDAIFCRNVVIYFDREAAGRLFSRFADVLKPGGYLYIGHSESLYGASDRFHYVGQSIYRKIA